MDKQKILMVIGSLRRQSLNRQLAEAGAELLKDQAEVSVLDYTRLPFINPDMEFPVPDEVQKIRDRISGADGVWIFFPEYNYKDRRRDKRVRIRCSCDTGRRMRISSGCLETQTENLDKNRGLSPEEFQPGKQLTNIPGEFIMLPIQSGI